MSKKSDYQRGYRDAVRAAVVALQKQVDRPRPIEAGERTPAAVARLLRNAVADVAALAPAEDEGDAGAACADERVRLPDVRLDFSLVGHGYQLDVYYGDPVPPGFANHEHYRTSADDLTRIGGECHDFGDSYPGQEGLDRLRLSLVAGLLARVDQWRHDPVRGTPKWKPTITQVHVDQHAIRRNKKNGTREPVITVKQGKTNRRGTGATIPGGCKVVYSPDKPLSCGARVWLETSYHVEVEGEVPMRARKARRGAE